MRAGICGFVEKPLFRSALKECLLEHLNGKKQSEHQQMSFDFSGKTFLLAEDNELNREIALELLGNMGAGMETAVNGEEAVKRFKESPPNYYSLILMDIQMPVMNGYEAARALRACSSARSEEVKIVALTANAFAEDVKSALDAGMDAHVAKPVDIDGLACVLGKVCG